jgi:hypothetical protein
MWVRFFNPQVFLSDVVTKTMPKCGNELMRRKSNKKTYKLFDKFFKPFKPFLSLRKN